MHCGIFANMWREPGCSTILTAPNFKPVTFIFLSLRSILIPLSHSYLDHPGNDSPNALHSKLLCALLTTAQYIQITATYLNLINNNISIKHKIYHSPLNSSSSRTEFHSIFFHFQIIYVISVLPSWWVALPYLTTIQNNEQNN